MAFELREGQGTIWDNRNRKRQPKHPDYTGEIKLNGKVMAIALWSKESRNGEFFSVQVSEKRAQGATASLPRADEPAPSAQQPQQQQPPQEDGSDIPF